MSHVFTYGSLMFDRVWSRVVCGTYPAAAATLSGFRRQRVLDQDYPSLQRIDGSTCNGSAMGAGSRGERLSDEQGAGGDEDAGAGEGPDTGSHKGGSKSASEGEDALSGVVYLGVQADDLKALDEFEGSEYCRIQVQVTVRAQVDGGPAPGSLLLADTYLFIASDKVAPGPWDPDDFERERIERFLREYPPPRSA